MVTERDGHVRAKRPETGVCVDIGGDFEQLIVFNGIGKPLIFDSDRRRSIDFEGDETVSVHGNGRCSDRAVVIVRNIRNHLRESPDINAFDGSVVTGMYQTYPFVAWVPTETYGTFDGEE